MLTKQRYSAKDMLLWSRWETLVFLVFAAIVTFLYHVTGLTFLEVPWTPVALIGTAVAFIVGFQNNSAYGRIWEARKIWGGIVNDSRTWGMKTRDMITNEHAIDKVSEAELQNLRKGMVFRHIAWLTALRHAMRQKKKWERFDQEHTNKEWLKIMHIPEKESSLEEDLRNYLNAEDLAQIMTKGNKATAILYLQSGYLRQLKEKGLIWEFSFLELENLLQSFFTLQGKSERIKNFPYPRQYASLSFYFVRVFLVLLPFGLVPEFGEIGKSVATLYPHFGEHFIWLAVPFCAIVSWVFHVMERIARAGENPFEGTANDVPISTIARGIEIDLRQQMGDDRANIPEQFPEVLDIQM